MKFSLISLAIAVSVLIPLPANALLKNEIVTVLEPKKESLRQLLKAGWKITFVSSRAATGHEVIYLGRRNRTQNIVCFLKTNVINPEESTSLCFAMN